MALAYSLIPEYSYAAPKDTIPPKIILYGPVKDSIPLFSKFVDPGYIYSDNITPTNQIIFSISGTFYATFKTGLANKIGNYNIIYTAIDSSGNKNSVERMVKVYDAIAPQVILKGPVNVSICQYSVYKDSGYIVNYQYPANLKIDTSGTFYSSGGTTAQAYRTLTITYVAKDTSSENTGSATRTITILPAGSYPCNSAINIASGSRFDFNIYPNPASHYIIIEPRENQIIRLRIVDVLGRIVLENSNIWPGILQIPVSELNPGIYSIIIDAQNGLVTKRFVKN